jgi:lipid A disaccharide synthetase
VTELMQSELNGTRLASELTALLDNRRNEEVRGLLQEVANQLGEGGASSRAADAVLRSIQSLV